jgi:hypothetical protein
MCFKKLNVLKKNSIEIWSVFFQEGSRQAESNLKFLLVLKDPCHELSDAKPAK